MEIIKVLFTENALKSMKEIILKFGKRAEIGGCLVGCQINDVLLVTHASEPGPKAKMSRYAINIDNKYTTRFSNRINQLSNNKLYYLGDWHTHLSTDLRPSVTDLRALKVLNNYVPKQFKNTVISVIMNHFDSNQLKAYKFSIQDDTTLNELQIEIITDPEWLSKFI
ncbi:hypothetical protein C7Y47_11315 [Lysinibacillus sphaericus]|uniref:JAB domain-containing protein n=1 Tax=Lysinibacillus sphaericus TaxID=1421 RepID=A0A544UK36_LYSSH|nr:Mov34/MPN/PAD-1 family protein [Lysinibacillus sp. SDF0037]TQR33621.1 hypothetical protein C7Y47_11315 [Lysinibacillus sp. SDF0037]